MKTAHALSIALLLGLAAALGALAATHTATTSRAQAAAAAPATATIAGRTGALDRWQRQLHAALHRKPPKLPRLVHFAPVVASAPAAPALISRVAAPAERTIYVHATAPTRPAHGGEREHEHEGGEGGGHDD
jgi:hypothetical protein